MALAKISTRVYNRFMEKSLINTTVITGNRCLPVIAPTELLVAKKKSRFYYVPIKSIQRQYATAVESVQDIRKRVFKTVTNYDKIIPDKVKNSSHFIQDLGLDSLDHIEIMMAMEDEFGFEIPDSDAEKLLTLDDIIKYIAKRENIEEEPQTENT